MRRQDTSDESKAKAKDLSFQAKARDLIVKARLKDLTFKAKAKAKDLKIVLKDSLRTRPRPGNLITARQKVVNEDKFEMVYRITSLINAANSITCETSVRQLVSESP